MNIRDFETNEIIGYKNGIKKIKMSKIFPNFQAIRVLIQIFIFTFMGHDELELRFPLRKHTQNYLEEIGVKYEKYGWGIMLSWYWFFEKTYEEDKHDKETWF